jgi:hypothetical protein
MQAKQIYARQSFVLRLSSFFRHSCLDIGHWRFKVPLGSRDLLAFHRPTNLALGFGCLLVLAFVVVLFATGDGEFDFGAAFFEVHFEGDEGVAAFGGFAGELGDLAAVHEEFAGAFGFVVEAVAHRVFGDVAVHEPNFAARDLGVGFFEAGDAVAQAFHFGAG